MSRTYAPCAPGIIRTHSKFSHTTKAPLAVPVTVTATDEAEETSLPTETPQRNVSVRGFFSQEVKTASFDSGAFSEAEPSAVVVALLLPPFAPRREVRFGRRVQKTM